MTHIRILAIFLSLSVLYSESKAQNIEVMGGNILNGAVTGSILGAATMGLYNNSDDFSPLRIGVGAGIIGGAGIAVYDYTTLSPGEQFFISGIFNDGRNTSIIILLDTAYGAGFGAVIGAAGMMLLDKPVINGIQYGGSLGAWAGFGFGLVDAFIIADRTRDLIGADILNRDYLFSLNSENYKMGFFQPSGVRIANVQFNDITRNVKPALGVVSFRMSL